MNKHEHMNIDVLQVEGCYLRNVFDVAFNMFSISSTQVTTTVTATSVICHLLSYESYIHSVEFSATLEVNMSRLS